MQRSRIIFILLVFNHYNHTVWSIENRPPVKVPLAKSHHNPYNKKDYACAVEQTRKDNINKKGPCFALACFAFFLSVAWSEFLPFLPLPPNYDRANNVWKKISRRERKGECFAHLKYTTRLYYNIKSEWQELNLYSYFPKVEPYP